ncbi:MAG: AAA family ATPase [Cyanobacteriota bacterium]|nr:AAA family ATPase [Cyanobacteriota bacterium]
MTGKLPFETSDPIELVYCHIAKKPPTPEPQFSTPLINIVFKLMAKNAEDRYQSALGLKYDLEQCLQQLETTGKIISFELGTRDICDRFIIPEKLYGREQEVQTLLDAFVRVASSQEKRIGNAPQSPEMILVAGFSGIGKTAVINEVHKPIVRQRGYFIKGKYDQFNRNIPLGAFVQAFRDLMNQLLGESNTNLVNWKTKILQTVRENGQILIDVIPELERIIGQQQPVPELSGSAAQNRFNLVFSKFVSVFTTKEHPLVIFLDDLQWADSASLNLLKLLISESETGYLLVLGAYRDNEVFPAHPLMLALNEIQKQEAIVNTLNLTPLDEVDITQLVADTLRCSTEIAAPLSTLVYQKTQGNPFFTTQFLKGLYEDGCIAFNFETGYWQCDLTQVRQLALTDDVVEFMVRRLQKLSEATQNVLKLAACIGNQFDLETLAVVCEQTQDEVATSLWRGLQEGFVIPENDTYKFFQGDRSQDNSVEKIVIRYRFLHDRVQQAAYSLIPESDRSFFHYTISQLLLKNTLNIEQDANLFDIVSHLNLGAQYIQDQSQILQACQLNLLAGQKAKASTAYQAGASYLKNGIQLLPNESWLEYYQLTLSLYKEAIECHYLAGEFATAEALVEVALQQLNSLIDQATINAIRLVQYQNSAAYEKAISVGLESLEMLGLTLPLSPDQLIIQQAAEEVNQNLNNRTVDSLVSLPQMESSQQQMLVLLLINMIPPTYIANHRLMVLVILSMTNLCLKHGNTPLSSFVYLWYGTVLCSIFKEYEKGDQFGLLGLKLHEKFNIFTLEGKIYMTFGSFISHWRRPLQEGLDWIQRSYSPALEAGELSWCFHGGSFNFWKKFLRYKHLDNVAQEQKSLVDFSHKVEITVSLALLIQNQVIANLQGKVEDSFSLNCENFDETSALDIFAKSQYPYGISTYYFAKAFIYFSYDDYLTTCELLRKAEETQDSLYSQFQTVLHHFYQAISFTQLYKKADLETQKDYLHQLEIRTKNFQILSENCPENYLTFSLLLAAEVNRIQGHYVKALDYYDQAITDAKANQYTQLEALANELAAKFYLNWGKEKVAAGYMQEAYYCYARWGAKAKTDNLEKRYPNLLEPILQQLNSTRNPIETLATIAAPKLSIHSYTKKQSSSSSINTALDFAAVLKASQALSGIIQLDKLLHQLSQIILQNSGSDRACFILPNSDKEWYIEAMATAEKTELYSVPLEDNPHLPVKLIQYVKNTQEVVVIDDLKTDIPLIDDYFSYHKPKSILCVPLLNQTHLIGILYLENQSTSHAFTEDRILVINFLCTQAAISLENARLYRQEQEKLEQLQEKNHLLAFQSTVSHIAARNEDLSSMLQQFCQTIVDQLDAAFARIWILRPAENMLELKASAGMYTHINGGHQFVPVGKFKIGLIAEEKEAHLTNDVLNDPRVGDHDWARREGMVSFAGYPLMLGSELLGVVAMFARSPLSDAVLTSLQVVATEISLGIRRKYLETSVEQKAIALENTLIELQSAQLQRVQGEKMAALGNLVAGVAHEINNPLGFLNGSINNANEYIKDILGHLELYQEHYPNPPEPILEDQEEIDLEYLYEDLPKLLESMQTATDRIRNISISLRNFSRTDTENKVSADLHEGLDSTLLLLKYRLKASENHSGIKIIKEYGELPPILSFPGQLNQVFMNLLANAIDAFDEVDSNLSNIDKKGKSNRIKIRTSLLNENQVQIQIEDNGYGMNEETRDRIFEQGFTTKGVGKGTGLGMAIAHQIITEKHGGTITCDSTPGKGTLFTITLPTA